jgi:hypothetical protein
MAMISAAIGSVSTRLMPIAEVRPQHTTANTPSSRCPGRVCTGSWALARPTAAGARRVNVLLTVLLDSDTSRRTQVPADIQTKTPRSGIGAITIVPAAAGNASARGGEQWTSSGPSSPVRLGVPQSCATQISNRSVGTARKFFALRRCRPAAPFETWIFHCARIYRASADRTL